MGRVDKTRGGMRRCQRATHVSLGRHEGLAADLAKAKPRVKHRHHKAQNKQKQNITTARLAEAHEWEGQSKGQTSVCQRAHGETSAHAVFPFEST